MLLTLKGTSGGGGGGLELMDGADYTRVPNAGVDDETTPTEVPDEAAVAATHSQKLRRSKTDSGSTSNSSSTKTEPTPDPAPTAQAQTSTDTYLNTDTGTYRNKFEGGKSWMKVSFPSAKDPTWHQRFPKLSTCVITIEADDDFVRPIEGSKPQMYAILPKTASASGNGDVQRLIDRVCNDVVEVFPQLGGEYVCPNNHSVKKPSEMMGVLFLLLIISHGVVMHGRDMTSNYMWKFTSSLPPKHDYCT
uniref:Uncharacterized protein n=1 Tax=Proboscia inermis TaxID=420281 RepID=A0A7S0GEG8_9STRA